LYVFLFFYLRPTRLLCTQHKPQVFRLTDQHSDGLGARCLSGTSEVALAGMVANKVFEEEKLPLKYVAHSHCFRAEAGGLQGVHSK
jgi:seryl-tRNA synthetase